MGMVLDPHGTQRHLTADAMLELLHPPARIGEPDRPELFLAQGGVREDPANGLGGQLLDADVRVPTELRRVHAHDECFAHGLPRCR